MNSGEITERKVLQKILNEKTLALIAIISLAIAIASFLHQLRTVSRDVQCQILSCDELTTTSSKDAGGLKAEYYYAEKKVEHLWRLELLLSNSGNAVIIGQGPSSNLIGNGISLQFPEKCDILEHRIDRKDFPLTIDKLSKNELNISFVQWRPKEIVKIIAFISASTCNSDEVRPFFPDREIVDGDLTIESSPTPKPRHNGQLFDYLPRYVIYPSYFFAVIMFIFSMVIMTIAAFHMFRTFRLKIWYRKEKVTLRKFLEQDKTIKSQERAAYFRRPSAIPKENWEGYPGKAFPYVGKTVSLTYSADDLGLFSIFFFIALLFSVYAATAIYDFYLAIFG